MRRIGLFLLAGLLGGCIIQTADDADKVEETGFAPAIDPHLVPETEEITLNLIPEPTPPPGLRDVRIKENENSAISSLRTINTIQYQFSIRLAGSAYENIPGTGYGTLAELRGPADRPYLDEALCQGTKNGYLFRLSLTEDRRHYQLRAAPIRPGATGNRYFYTDDEVLFILVGPDASVNSASPRVED